MPIIVVAAVIYNDSKFSRKEMQADQNMVSHVFTCLGETSGIFKRDAATSLRNVKSTVHESCIRD